MPFKAPEAVTYEGRSNEALQLAGRAKKSALRLTAGAATGSTQVELPVSANTQPFAVYMLTNLGTVPIFYALGTSAVTVDHTTDNCDDVVLSGQAIAICNVDATHIVAITEETDADLLVAPCV